MNDRQVLSNMRAEKAELELEMRQMGGGFGMRSCVFYAVSPERLKNEKKKKRESAPVWDLLPLTACV